MSYRLVEFDELIIQKIDNRGKTPPFSDSGYPILEVKHIQDNQLYPDFTDTKFVSQETWNNWFRQHLEPGDILFSTVGSIARCCIVPNGKKFAIAQNILGFRFDKSKILPRYAYYAMTSPFFMHEVKKRVVETVQQSIKYSDLRYCKVPLPDIETQKEIAHILGTLDDKIELNRKMNKTLEEIAQALYKHWFVDFEFPNAEGKPYKSSGGEMIDSELGLIPKGWRVGKLEELGRIVTGKTPSTIIDSHYGSDIPFITIPDMHNSTYVTKTQKMLSIAGADSQKAQYIPKESICVSCIATLGLVSLTSELSQTNQQINSIIPDRPEECYFTYMTARNLSQFIKGSGSGGSVFSNLNKGIFSKLQLVMATWDSKTLYNRIVSSLFTQIFNNLRQNASIAVIRENVISKTLN